MCQGASLEKIERKICTIFFLGESSMFHRLVCERLRAKAAGVNINGENIFIRRSYLVLKFGSEIWYVIWTLEL